MDLDDHFGSSVSMRPFLGHSSKFYRTDCNGTYSQGRGIQGNILKKSILPSHLDWVLYIVGGPKELGSQTMIFGPVVFMKDQPL